MTFLSVVFAILISGSSASMPLKAQTLTGTSIRDTAQQRKIMEKAFRVNRQGERILGNNNNNNGLSGQYSIEFDTCVALSTEPDDDGQFIFDASLLSSTLNKTIVPQVSYVVFSACKTQYCDYYEQKNKDLYMIDLATYMDALAEFYTERQETYCEACMDSYSYCQWYQYQKSSNKYYNNMQGYVPAEEEEVEEEEPVEGEEENVEGGGRKLNRNNYDVINCNTCSKMNCFYSESVAEAEAAAEGSEAVAPPDIETIAEWVNEVAQCQETEMYYLNYYRLYSGFMCNQDGSGVDIATFLDEECKIYNGNTAYKTIASTTDQSIMYAASDMITFPFLHRINCNSGFTYLSMDEYRQETQGYNNGQDNQDNNNNNNNNQASTYCSSIFSGGDAGSALDLTDCNGDGEEDDDDENADEVTEYVDPTYGFSYSLTSEVAESMSSICKVIRNMQGEYEVVYRWSGSGQLYNYGSGPSSKSASDFFGVKSYLSAHSLDKMGTPLITAIVVAVAIAATAFGCIVYSCCSSTSLPNKYVEQRKQKMTQHRKDLDNKREPLVEEEPVTGTGHLM